MQIANILWALATAGTASRELFEAARIDLETRNAKYLNPVDMANIVWAFATVSADVEYSTRRVGRVDSKSTVLYNPRYVARSCAKSDVRLAYAVAMYSENNATLL